MFINERNSDATFRIFQCPLKSFELWKNKSSRAWTPFIQILMITLTSAERTRSLKVFYFVWTNLISVGNWKNTESRCKLHITWDKSDSLGTFLGFSPLRLRLLGIFTVSGALDEVTLRRPYVYTHKHIHIHMYLYRDLFFLLLVIET